MFFTITMDERVPSSSELLVDVLFLLMRENILSSPALECGIVMMYYMAGTAIKVN